MTTFAAPPDGVITLDETGYAELFDRIAQKNMGISGEEFLQRWDAGDYVGVDWDSVDGLVPVAMSVNLVR
jgi:hypothetical protein